MAEWVVTYTSMPIEADTAEEAISREGSGGGHWNAYPIRQHPEALEVHADIWPGDADLAVILGSVGGLRLAVYQHRNEQDRPLPVVVLDPRPGRPVAGDTGGPRRPAAGDHSQHHPLTPRSGWVPSMAGAQPTHRGGPRAPRGMAPHASCLWATTRGRLSVLAGSVEDTNLDGLTIRHRSEATGRGMCDVR
jgi:hypothetical protein